VPDDAHPSGGEGTPSHPMLQHLVAAAEGRFPAVDGGITVVPPLGDGRVAVVSFTGHAVIAADVAPADLFALGADGFGGATHPRVLLHLADLGGPSGWIGSLDVTLVASGRRSPDDEPPSDRSDPVLPLTDRWDDHPRVEHARTLRSDVRVHGDERGLVTIATGLGGRCEMSVAVADGTGGGGTGRSLIRAARALVDAGTPLFAGVAPGNARSLRAFLAEGFAPIASEVLISPASRDRAVAQRGA